MAEGLQDELLAHALLLQEFGPNLGRPTVDTLNGSKFPNMKELRFNWEGEVWRVAFGFHAKRQAILLAGGDKAGAGQKRFYKRLIGNADERYGKHLTELGGIRAGERGRQMARNLDHVLERLPAERRTKIEERAAELATLKDLRQAMLTDAGGFGGCSAHRTGQRFPS